METRHADRRQETSHPPALIVVGGMPASGKSTIAERLATELGIAWINKDGIKETIFDAARRDDRGWLSQLGVVSMQVLYHVAERHLAARQPLIIESNFDPELATAQLGDLRERHPFRLVQVICVADEAELIERFTRRATGGERHPAHLDDPGIQEMATRFARQDQPIDLPGTVIEVDTTDFDAVDLAAIARQIRVALGSQASGTPA